MLYIPFMLIATIVIFMPSAKSQCVNCTDYWGGSRLIDETGYYCEPGASIYEGHLGAEDYATSTVDPNGRWSSCVPYPYTLESVRNYCCLWSQKLGCNAAVGTLNYGYGNPVRYCDRCRNKCARQAHSVCVSPINWFILCCMSILLERLL